MIKSVVAIRGPDPDSAERILELGEVREVWRRGVPGGTRLPLPPLPADVAYDQRVDYRPFVVGPYQICFGELSPDGWFSPRT